MANPVSIYHASPRVGSKCFVQGTITASYKRTGSKVVITIATTNVKWAGRYAQISLKGTGFLVDAARNNLDASDVHEYIYTPKTFTYTQTAATTYTYTLTTYIQYVAGESGFSNTYTLTIDVPAASALAYVNVNGTWKQATPWVNVNGTWKKALSYINSGGAWKQ